MAFSHGVHISLQASCSKAPLGRPRASTQSLGYIYRRELYHDANRRPLQAQEQQQQRVRRIAYWLLAAFCIGSALLVTIHVSSRSSNDHW